VNFLLYWAYFTWDLYQKNQQYEEFLKVILQNLAENPGGSFAITSWTSSNPDASLLWYGLVTFPFFMSVYVFYKNRH